MSHKAQIFSNNKVMPNVLTLQISIQYTFPSQSYKAPKWQIWKCELGWFSLGQSHMDRSVDAWGLQGLGSLLF